MNLPKREKKREKTKQNEQHTRKITTTKKETWCAHFRLLHGMLLRQKCPNIFDDGMQSFAVVPIASREFQSHKNRRHNKCLRILPIHIGLYVCYTHLPIKYSHGGRATLLDLNGRAHTDAVWRRDSERGRGIAQQSIY